MAPFLAHPVALYCYVVFNNERLCSVNAQTFFLSSSSCSILSCSSLCRSSSSCSSLNSSCWRFSSSRSLSSCSSTACIAMLAIQCHSWIYTVQWTVSAGKACSWQRAAISLNAGLSYWTSMIISNAGNFFAANYHPKLHTANRYCYRKLHTRCDWTTWVVQTHNSLASQLSLLCSVYNIGVKHLRIILTAHKPADLGTCHFINNHRKFPTNAHDKWARIRYPSELPKISLAIKQTVKSRNYI